jgi:hypothetical protein
VVFVPTAALMNSLGDSVRRLINDVLLVEQWVPRILCGGTPRIHGELRRLGGEL